MNYPKTNKNTAPDEVRGSLSALFACGLWLRIGAVGAFGLMGVLHQMVNGEMQPLSALALAAASTVLVVTSWWRARVVLDREVQAVPATAAALPANRAVSGSVA